jgi:hypothetical protein
MILKPHFWLALAVSVWPVVTTAQIDMQDNQRPLIRTCEAGPGELTSRLCLANLQPGDQLMVASDSADVMKAGHAGVSWLKAADTHSAEGICWKSLAQSHQAEPPLQLSLLEPGQGLTMSVERMLADGSQLQVTRMVLRTADGDLALGPETIATVRSMFRVTGKTALAPGQGFHLDDQGRAHLPAGSPSLAALAGQTRQIEPYIVASAEVEGDWKILDSVSGSGNARNIDLLCSGGVYAGSKITIGSAPANATITSVDLDANIYHPIDISRFKVGLFRNLGGFKQLYTGSQSGSNWLAIDVNLAPYWTGQYVNAFYHLGTCAIYAIEGGYLQSWTLTLYYDPPGGNIDLQAGNISASTASVDAGDSVSVTWDGLVAGTGTVGGSFSTGLYLSPDNNITIADTLLASRNENTANDPGDTFGDNGYSLTIPGGTAPGYYYLGIIIDRNFDIDESNESNNVAWTALTVTSASVSNDIDLIAASLTASASKLQPGETYTVSYLGFVAGTGTVPNTFPVGIYLSDDSTITTDDTRVTIRTGYSTDEPGETFYESAYTLPVPASYPVGPAYLGVFVDYSDRNDETNESNNTLSIPVVITSGSVYIPAAAHAAGVGTSQWMTDLEVRALGGSNLVFTIELLEKDTSNTSPEIETLSIAAGACERFNDVLSTVFDFDGAAALRLTPVTGELIATSRTYNDSPSGTFGQYIAGESEENALPAGQEAILIQLSQSATSGIGFRTNLGFVNTTNLTVWVRIDAYYASGLLLGTKNQKLLPYGHHQVNEVFKQWGNPNVEDGFIIVSTATSGGAFFAYASVVDNMTDDPVYVPMKLIE